MKRFLPVLSITILLSGCSTLETVKNDKGAGIKQSYAASYDATWQASICAVESKDLSLKSKDKSKGTILAQNGMSAFSFGENVAIFVRKINPNSTEVEVVSKRALQTNVFAPDWGSPILNEIKVCLKQ